MTTYDPDRIPARPADAFMRDDRLIAPPMTEDELRDLQARFDAEHLRPLFDRKQPRGDFPRWVAPAVLVFCLLVYLGAALALEERLFGR